MSGRFIAIPGFRAAGRDLHKALRGPAESVSEEDPGYFGPASVSWRVYWHPCTGVAGFAALLIQALHPVAMSAVDTHSTYKTNGWTRAMGILEYEFAVVYGGRALADRMTAHVRKIHARIGGTDPHTGREYRADDEDLLLWIHCASAEAVLQAYRILGPGLTAQEEDQFVAERVEAARLIGVETLAVPETRAELTRYIDSMRSELALTPAAADVLAEFSSARAPLSTRLLWKIHLLGAIDVLPPWVQEIYNPPARLRGGRIQRAFLRAALNAIRVGYALSPGFRPSRRHLRSMQRRAAAQRPGVAAR